jgi:integrase
MAEFTGDERARVVAQLDPRDSRQWRAWVLITLFAYCGPRQRAARYLQWTDVDLERGVIRWAPETDKMATERFQPMPTPVLEAFWVAYGWRVAQGYTGRFVFYAAARSVRDDDRPWTYQAFSAALHKAEERAGMTKTKYRGAHGFRRGIAGDIHAATGSSKSAADWIGDRSVKVVERHYLLERDEELRKTAALVTKGGEDSATRTNANATKRNGPANEGEAGTLNPVNQGSTDDL